MAVIVTCCASGMRTSTGLISCDTTDKSAMGTPVEIEATGPRQSFQASRLEQVFNDCFVASLSTRLCGGAAEPLYQPACGDQGMHVLHFREDYFASALHEIAHWCIAGPQRRLQVDFGYWYAPDGRNNAQQCAFEAVEYKPQALEWFFCKACDYRFRLSMDNLDEANGGLPDTSAFQQRVLSQAQRWQQDGLPDRAALFYAALCREFGSGEAVSELRFERSELL